MYHIWYWIANRLSVLLIYMYFLFIYIQVFVHAGIQNFRSIITYIHTYFKALIVWILILHHWEPWKPLFLWMFNASRLHVLLFVFFTLTDSNSSSQHIWSLILICYCSHISHNNICFLQDDKVQCSTIVCCTFHRHIYFKLCYWQ